MNHLVRAFYWVISTQLKFKITQSKVVLLEFWKTHTRVYRGIKFRPLPLKAAKTHESGFLWLIVACDHFYWCIVTLWGFWSAYRTLSRFVMVFHTVCHAVCYSCRRSTIRFVMVYQDGLPCGLLWFTKMVYHTVCHSFHDMKIEFGGVEEHRVWCD